MTNIELISKMFGYDFRLLTGCQGIACSDSNTPCRYCVAHNFWEQEADLRKINANISTNELAKLFYKAALNSLYGRHIGKTIIYKDTDSTVFKEAFKNGSTQAVFPMNKPIEDEWIEVPALVLADEFQTIGEILDDATVHGLDFKYENGKFYYKERQAVPN